MTEKSIAVSERTHASLFLLQAKLQVLEKKRYSMNKIIDRLMTTYEKETQQILNNLNNPDFKLENIET